MNDIKNIVSNLVLGTINEIKDKKKNPIFVLLGIEPFIDINKFSNSIIDYDTFGKNGNEELFSKDWFTSVFKSLTIEDKPFSILSFSQFSYVVYYMHDFFNERIVIIRDNLRHLFPLEGTDYIEQSSGDNLEERSPQMPIYMAEQVKIGNHFYFSVQMPVEDFEVINLFNNGKKLESMKANEQLEVIDTVSNPYSMDTFINECIFNNSFSKRVLVKSFKKQPLKDSSKKELELINWLLGLFGGELFELEEKPISEDFTPQQKTLELLTKYWGQNACFRNLRVYKNPDYGNDIISISQGLIVETIIKEYENAKQGKEVRDLFLTAPTGAGKSLLFQLPAFYISSKNDVTIVVSPLIALMKDQVKQIQDERGFKKVYFLNSELSLIDRERIINDCKKGDIDILYLSPELLLSYDISYFIGDRKLGLLVIDEAHLITTWGRDFRVDYWFLGQHINKIRKYHDYHFTMVAVTATAIYGGENDMVFDSVNSLYMHDPHLYIGEVKRDDISFVIDNHEPFKTNYDSEKVKETVQFIEDINKAGIKTIVYAPYRKHIDNIIKTLEADGFPNIAESYHSGYVVDSKNLAYENFRTNKTKIMVSTKAFGMGVDIPDIQVVYHHAPSGLLPDYVQEIGRAARKPEIKGFAALSYAMEDQRFSKILHGMSALRHFQIKEVLNKIYKTYLANKKRRNMLISSADFGYIFNNAQDYDQRVMTALMMIEKDYLAKYRFNVLIARPKKLFVKVYCQVDNTGLNYLYNSHAGRFTHICSKPGNRHILELNLDEIWKNSFSNQSFPLIKKNFYNETLFSNDGIEIKAQVKLSFTLDNDINIVLNQFSQLLDNIQGCLSRLKGSFFDKDEFSEALSNYIQDKQKREKVVDFILASYSDRSLSPNEIDGDAFLQRRNDGNQKDSYRVFSSQYANNFANLKRKLQRLYANNNSKESTIFVSFKSEYLLNYIRIGSLLEILGLGTYESKGGDKPMIFIRLNDPDRIARDVKNASYKNSLLTAIEGRYKSSTSIYDHFFLHTLSNEERWNFIEDYFLGKSTDELLQDYPGGERNHINIIQYINDHIIKDNAQIDVLESNNKELTFFLPKENGYYSGENQLNIDGKIMKVSKWISNNPVALDKTRRKYKLVFANDIFQILMSRLKNEHFPYYRDSLGLNLWIDFPNYPSTVKAQIVYDNEPIKFYNWWRKNEDKVFLTKSELLQLLLKVDKLSPNTLLKKHKKIINEKKI